MVGAGVAGAVTARELALRGVRTLVVERARPPRDTVCGGCLAASALRLLADLDLGGLPSVVRSPVTTRLDLCAAGVRAELPLPPGRAVRRLDLDAELLDAAVAAGAELLCGTRAGVGPAVPGGRLVTLHPDGGGEERRVVAGVVVLATGLGRLPVPDMRSAPRRGSRVGAGTRLAAAGGWPEPGVVAMAVGRGGYVGAVRLAGGEVGVAAALDSGAVRRAGGVGPAAARIVRDAGLEAPPGLEEAAWRATPPLSRRTDPVATERVFAVGDAAGYVEPFTGEGMAWAMAGAVALAPLAAAGARRWDPVLARTWRRRHRALLAGPMRRCRAVAAVARRPRLAALAARLLAVGPGLAGLAVRRVLTAGPSTGGGSRARRGSSVWGWHRRPWASPRNARPSWHASTAP